MMKKDNLEHLFKHLESDFDIESPNKGHEKRFLSKLNNKAGDVSTKYTIRSLWRPITGIAASIVLLISVFIGLNQDNNTLDLASISPEMAQTQSFSQMLSPKNWKNWKPKLHPKQKN